VVLATWSVIGGGSLNTIRSNALFSSVSGGRFNSILDGASSSTIGGGGQNEINGTYSTISGGSYNEVNGDSSTISGGYRNTNGGHYATIPGGSDNLANAYAFAAGRRAKANHTGAFVWADSTDADFPSERTGQFRVRAGGGARFDINGGHWIDLRNTGSIANPPIRVINTSTGGYLSSGGAWTDSSDRNRKENFQPVNAPALLEKVLALPLSTWNYKAEDASIRHVGPVAQDFHAAFGVGADDRHIAALDGNGVALAAIQGLNQKLEEKLQQKETEITELKRAVAELKELVGRLAGEAVGGTR
jgi:hypothetical protein